MTLLTYCGWANAAIADIFGTATIILSGETLWTKTIAQTFIISSIFLIASFICFLFRILQLDKKIRSEEKLLFNFHQKRKQKHITDDEII